MEAKRTENNSLVSIDRQGFLNRKAIKTKDSKLEKRLLDIEGKLDRQYQLSISIIDAVHQLLIKLDKEEK